MDPTESPEKAISPRTAAFAVHVFTACGAACALLALIAAVSADWPKMFVWLGIALVIDLGILPADKVPHAQAILTDIRAKKNLPPIHAGAASGS